MPVVTDTGANATSDAPGTAATTAARSARRPHVAEIDVVRVMTFAAVVAVHTVANANPTTAVAPNAILMLLHFTRSAFFVLTGFVLMHQYLGRPLAVRNFWRRRITLVAVPYIGWSVLYTALGQVQAPHGSAAGFLRTLGPNLAFGQAWYHLYFLLVSLQIYLLFPLIRKMVTRTAGWHGRLLILSAAIQLALLAWLRYGVPTSGWGAGVTAHADALLPTYQFYVLAGAVAACHLDRLRSWLLGHVRSVLLAVSLTAVLAEVWFAVTVAVGDSPLRAADVLQPAMFPWSAAATVGLATLGAVWASRRKPASTTARWLQTASDRSFGVYLVHPAILWAVLSLGHGWIMHSLPAVIGTAVVYLIVLAAAAGFTEGARRTAASLLLTGRPRLRTGRHLTAALPSRPAVLIGRP